MLAHATTPNPVWAWANTAVLIFYALSGYGCTATMQCSYQDHPWRFLLSRYLRLWPGYLAVFALTSIVWALIELPDIAMPTGLDWWLALLMIKVSHVSTVPTAWVLPYMLMGYVAIAAGASGNARRSLLWLAVSFALAQHRAILGSYYSSLAAWSLAYSVGAAAYWMRVKVPRATGWAGEIAFPLFLSHYLVLSALRSVYGFELGLPLFIAALAPTLCLSWLLVLWVEQPIARYRQSFKHNTLKEP
jgi:peptidoglycan/LPS O-acetylase OafA/YrhL